MNLVVSFWKIRTQDPSRAAPEPETPEPGPIHPHPPDPDRQHHSSAKEWNQKKKTFASKLGVVGCNDRFPASSQSSPPL